MRKLAAATALMLVIAGPVLAQGTSPNSSSGASGNAEETNKPKTNSSGGGGSGQ